MIRETEIVVHPNDAYDSLKIKFQFCKQTSVSENELQHFSIHKRSLDARGKDLKYRIKIRYSTDEKITESDYNPNYQNVKNAREVHIIGAGPAGYFAALKLMQKGIKPVLFDRGKDVRSRRRDLVLLTREGKVNSDSNYCFGEGGAGTYSDGKLYTRSTKRGDVQEILQTLVYFGADKDILIDAHPHIGTNKLPGIITAMRECIENYGGEVHFNSKLTDIIYDTNGLKEIEIDNQKKIKCNKLILATGHSARDIFELLFHKKILIEQKEFALGVRAEHPQELIDQFRYRCKTRPENIPPASYSLVEQVNGLGVYSFCMCPGGIIAPCATAPGEVVTNGWSPSKRNNPFANSGIVVTVTGKMTQEFRKFGPLAGMEFQKMVEQNAFKAAGENLFAPALRMVDFCENKVSATLPDCSYKPGITSTSMKNILPNEILERLQKAFKAFDKSMKGYYSNEAIIVAPESRTSSPVRIPRDKESLEHPQIKGLFPCGEGAGYAGGIVSAAIDGFRCASKC